MSCYWVIVAALLIVGSHDVESSRLRQQMEPGVVTVVDMKRDVTRNDYSLLLSDETNGMQQWVSRMDLCQQAANEKSKSLVLDAFKGRNGVKPNLQTCCVSVKEQNQCVLIDGKNAQEVSHLPPGTYLNKEGEDESSKIFVGVSGTWYGCPEGFEPLIFRGPFGIENSCCGTGFDTPSPEKKPCGANYCSTKLSLRETSYCDQLPPMETRRVASKHIDDVLSGPLDGENVCAVSPDQEEKEHLKSCEEKNEELMKENSEDDTKKGGQCAVCVRVLSSKVERECMECSRTRRASRNGWRCTSFGPDYPCGGSPEGVNQRSFEQKLDFAMHDTRDPMNEADLLTDFNDGRYRQGGAPDTTSPIRHHRKGHSLTASTLSYSSGLRFEASGSCPKLTKLNLQQNKDEPLHASSEDFSSDSQRLQNVLQGLGSVTGLGDVRTVLFPRVSASATLSDPFEMPFASGGSHHFSCSDSRATTPILGTPGGDLGEFVLAMNVMERARKEKTEPFSDEMILYYFQTYLQQMVERSGKTKFFMCSDEPSMMLWAKAAQVADPINPRGQGEIVRLIEYGSLQNHIGSAHLRSMVQRPEDYHSRHGLVEACVRAFLTVYYDATHPMRGHLVIGTHDGDYARGAVLYVDRNDGYPCGDQSPLVTPVDSNAVQSELFVVHRAAVDIYREQLARFVTEVSGYPVTYQPEVFEAMRDIGDIQLKATMSKLLKDVPRYVAHFT